MQESTDALHERVRLLEAQLAAVREELDRERKARLAAEASLRAIGVAEQALSASEAALQRTQELLHETNRIAQIGGWEYEIATQAVRWTSHLYAIHEVAPDYQPSLAAALAFYPDEARAIIQPAFERLLHDGTGYNLDIPMLTATGRRIWVRSQGRAVWQDGRIVGARGTFQDVTERKTAEILLTQQAQRLTQLRERERLARELNDGIVHVLAFIATQVQATRELLFVGRNALAGAALTALTEVVQQAQAEMQHLFIATGALQELRREELSGLRLLPALRRYADSLHAFFGLAVQLDAPAELADLPIAPLTELQLVQIVQEALTNVRKHAGTAQATVRLRRHDEQVVLTIEDSGRGFELAAPPTRGFGLQLMAGRAAEIGGRLELSSAPGSGTRVTVIAPFRAAEAPPLLFPGADAAPRPAASALAALSGRQQLILPLLAQRLTYKAIALRLGYSETTIKREMAQIFRRLQLTKRSEVEALLRDSAAPSDSERRR